VEVKQINAVYSKSLEARLHGGLDVLRAAVEREVRAVPDLGADENIVALAGALEPEFASGQFLDQANFQGGDTPFPNEVLRVDVDVGGIPECAARSVGSIKDLRMNEQINR
jgi:hypothetical protein